MFSKLKINNVGTYLTTGGGVALAQLLSFFSIPFIAKLTGPEEFGKYSYAITIYTILVVLCSLRLEYSIYTINSNMLYLLRAKFIRVVLVTAIILSFVAMYFLVGSFDLSIYLLSITSLFSVVYFEFAIQNNILEGKFKTNAYLRIARALVLPICFYLIYSIGGSSYEVVLLSFAISHLVPVLLLCKNERVASDHTILNYGLFKSIKSIFENTKSVIIYMIPAHLLNRFSAGMFLVIVGFFSSADVEIAFYAIAAKFLIAPVSIVTSAISDVVKKEVADSPKKALMNFYKISVITSIIAMGVSLIVYNFSADILGGVMGEKWSYAASYAIAILPYMAALLVCSPITHVYVVLGKQKYDLYWQILNMLCVSLALYLGMQTSLLTGVWYFSITYAISIMCSASLCVLFINKHKHLGDSAKGEKVR